MAAPPAFTQPAPPASIVLPSGQSAPMSFAGLVKACDPSVVTVRATEIVRRRGGVREQRGGIGSGFFFQSDGHILTNNHVVEGFDDLEVVLEDGTEKPARLVGRDPLTDVAIVKIDMKNAPFLRLGDNDQVEVGDWVVAIGNPGGLSHTVSSGIISAKGRTGQDIPGLDRTGRGYFNFLQTDAAINPGNSGGPLIDLRGQVIGINTAIIKDFNNVGFAIPVNMVKDLIPLIIRDGKVRRSAIGIGVDALNDVEAARLRRPNKLGALVRTVQPGNAADLAGVARDDVVVAFNGREIKNPEELRWRASLAGVGSAATIKVARAGRELELKLTLGALPDAE